MSSSMTFRRLPIRPPWNPLANSDCNGPFRLGHPGRDLLHDVQPLARRQALCPAVHNDALHARRMRVHLDPQNARGQARRRARPDDGRRKVYAGRGRVPGRVQQCAHDGHQRRLLCAYYLSYQPASPRTPLLTSSVAIDRRTSLRKRPSRSSISSRQDSSRRPVLSRAASSPRIPPV